MNFRLDFKEKLDLSKFKKQISFYIGLSQQLTYDLYLPDYKMSVGIETSDGITAHHVNLIIRDIVRDQDGDIIKENLIYPLTDTRFQEFNDVKAIFTHNTYQADFSSNSATNTVDKICKLLTILFKINKLKVFL